MPKSQRETHFEEISPALAKVVLNMSKLKDNKMKNKHTLFLYYFLGFVFLIYFLVLILIFT